MKKKPTREQKIEQAKAKKFQLKQGEASISDQTKKTNGKILVREYFEKVGDIQEFEGTPANVGFTRAETKNLGNYESRKTQVSLHMPCKPEDVNATLKFVTDWTNCKMEQVLSIYEE